MVSAVLNQTGRSVTTVRCQRNAARRVTVCKAENGMAYHLKNLGAKAAGVGAALLLSTAPAMAGEFDLLASSTPDTYVVDDASALNKTTEKEVGDALRNLEKETGYRIEVATVRRLEFEPDAFAFGDKLISKWFPGAAADKRGVLLVVTAGKDGALTGGKSFMGAVGDDLIDSIVGENIPILTEEEKYNETVSSSVKRIVAKLSGKEDPGAPYRPGQERKRTYKTKAETEGSKTRTTTIVVTLLAISFIVPMLQYFGYTNQD